MTHALPLSGKSLKRQSRNNRDVAKPAFGHFHGVDTRLQIVHQTLRSKQVQRINFGRIQGRIREQFKPVIIAGDGHGKRTFGAPTVGHEHANGLMDRFAFKWEHTDVVAVFGLELFNQNLFAVR